MVMKQQGKLEVSLNCAPMLNAAKRLHDRIPVEQVNSLKEELGRDKT